MYLNQKDFIFNVKELSVLLVKDANERFSDNHKENIQSKYIKNSLKTRS